MQCSSVWLHDIRGRPQLGQPLDRNLSVDVAVIGGGFVGLWAAIRIKELDPTVSVAILEQGRCGQGASGLNGGFVMSWWPKAGRIVSLAGEQDGLWLLDRSTENVAELRDFLAEESVDADFVMGGWLWTATAEVHNAAWGDVVDLARKLGRPAIYQPLSSDDLKRRTGSPQHLAGVIEVLNGNVHPGKLGYGLAEVARRRGIMVFEDTPVSTVEPGASVALRAGAHTVRAGHVVVASNIWASQMRELSRQAVCVTSAIVATPPMPERLAAIGWTGGESISDSQSMLNYYRTTRDGRVVYGKGVANLSYQNKVGPHVLADKAGIAATEADFRDRYPMLRDVPIEFGWSGPIDRSFDGLPIIGSFRSAPNMSYAIGWSGNGVGPSRIGGRILAGLALGLKDRWTQNSFVNRVGQRFPPEPIRYIAGSIVRRAVRNKDASEMAGHAVKRIDRLLASLAPAGTEDKR